MKIRSINVEIVRGQGKPLFYALNPMTLGSEKFAILKGMALGFIEAEAVKDRLAKSDALAAIREERKALRLANN